MFRAVICGVLVVAGGILGCRREAPSPAGQPATATAPTTVASTQPKAAWTIKVTDVRNTKGHLRLGVFNDAAGFPENPDKAVAWKSLQADAESPHFKLELPPGRYAVVVIHDENSNKTLDKNAIGIPKEGYGVSNNPKPRFRPARFDEAQTTLPDEGAEITISLQYF